MVNIQKNCQDDKNSEFGSKKGHIRDRYGSSGDKHGYIGDKCAHIEKNYGYRSKTLLNHRKLSTYW